MINDMSDAGGTIVSPRTRGSSSLADEAYRSIKSQLLTSQLAAGDIVTGTRLAEEFAMSRTPVHEALKKLCQEGFLRVISRVGYVVSSVRLHDIQEIFQLRLALEMLGVELATGRVTDSDIAKFEELELVARAGAESIQSDDSALFMQLVEANRDFHVRLATLSGNERLVERVRGLLDESQRIHLLDPRMRAQVDFGSMSDDHRQIVQSLASGDPRAAREAVGAHIQGAQRRIISNFFSDDLVSTSVLDVDQR